METSYAELEKQPAGRSWRDMSSRYVGAYAALYQAADLEGRRKILKATIGSLHLEPATRQRVRRIRHGADCGSLEA